MVVFARRIGIIVVALTLSGCASTSESRTLNRDYRGVASWYSSGHRTASGRRFNPSAFTVAHRKLPFGTKVQLTNPQNGSRITATVTDRGPFVKGRALDVSRGAAQALGFLRKGTQRLIMKVIGR